MIRTLAIAAVVLGVPALAAAQQPQAAPTPAVPVVTGAPAAVPGPSNIDPRDPSIDRDFRIGPEDVLDISVWKNAELSRTVPVRPDGMVSLPLVHDVVAAGRTPAELREELTKRLAEYVPAPEVAVIVREIHSAKVSVVGSVKTPGRYEVNSPSTVLDLIALAQGFTDFAARDRIIVIRQNGATPTRMPFNYRKVADGDEKANFLVRPGDIIVVP